jgi:hypothetical protein
LLRGANESGQSRHDGVGCLFALGEEENAKSVHVVRLKLEYRSSKSETISKAQMSKWRENGTPFQIFLP